MYLKKKKKTHKHLSVMVYQDLSSRLKSHFVGEQSTLHSSSDIKDSTIVIIINIIVGVAILKCL